MVRNTTKAQPFSSEASTKQRQSAETWTGAVIPKPMGKKKSGPSKKRRNK